MEYKLIRSKRKTLAVEIKNGEIIVRVPLKTSQSTIDYFVSKHQKWIETRLALQKATPTEPPFTKEQLKKISSIAKEVIPPRVEYYAKLMGINYEKVSIKSQKTRWGSCSSKGNLNFNCLLMLAPTEVMDSVIIHELCHRLEMNHSKKFYSHLLRYCPDYYTHKKWLKDNGSAFLKRIP